MAFLRTSELTIGNFRFAHPEFWITHEIEFDDEKEPNTSTITIYNLSKETRNALSKGDSVTYNAGYQDDGTGSVLVGVAYDIETTEDGTDTKTIISAYDVLEQYFTQRISKTYVAGTTNQYIIDDIFSSFGIVIGRNTLNNIVTYKNGYTAHGTLKNELEKLAVRDGGSRIITKNSVINIVPQRTGITEVILLSKNSKLLNVKKISNSNTNAEWKITSVFEPLIHARSILQVQSEELTATCLVVRGKHTTSWNTECEVIVI